MEKIIIEDDRYVEISPEFLDQLLNPNANNVPFNFNFDSSGSELELDTTNDEIAQDFNDEITADQWETCLSQIEDGTMKKSEAAKTLKTNRMNIDRKLKKREEFRAAQRLKPPPNTLFTNEQEQNIVDWVLTSQDRGGSRDFVDILDYSTNYAKELQLEITSKSGQLTRGWLWRFLKRHPELAVYAPSSVSKEAGNVPLERVRYFVGVIKKYILTHPELQAVAKDPSRMGNTDESCIEVNVKSKFYVGAKGKPMIVPDDAKSKTNFTVTYTAMATGEILTTQILLKNNVTDNEVREIETMMKGEIKNF